jgi:F0F1-type ATP synthase membrane subunit a
MFIILFLLFHLFVCLFIPCFTLMLSNIVDTYVLGFLSVFLILLRLVLIFGSISVGSLFYLFLSKLEIYLLILLFVELFSIFLKSLTLTNRLSINFLAGTLLVNLLSSIFLPFHPVAEQFQSLIGLVVTFMDFLVLFLLSLTFDFELFQIALQFFIFCLLHYSFNSIIIRNLLQLHLMMIQK